MGGIVTNTARAFQGHVKALTVFTHKLLHIRIIRIRAIVVAEVRANGLITA